MPKWSPPLVYVSDISLIALEDQLAALTLRYSDATMLSPSQISVPLFPKASVVLDLRRYPKRPKVRLPKLMAKSVGDLGGYIPGFRHWDPTEPLDLVWLLTAVERTVEILAGQKAHLTDKIVHDIVHLARAAAPKEMFCALRIIDGCFQEFLLAPGMAASSVSAVFYPTRIGQDPSIAGSCHSHPSGNPIPSKTDMGTFSRYRVNLICGAANNTIKLVAYNSRGVPIPLFIHTFGTIED